MQTEKPRLDPLSLIICAVVIMLLLVFAFIPWLNVEQNMSGFDIAASTTITFPQMEEAVFPNGVVFILPLVLGSILVQYFRRMWDQYRPRRRLTTVSMLLVGIVTTALWVRSYTVQTTDYLNLNDPALYFEQVNQNNALPVIEVDEDGKLRKYSRSEVLNEQFRFEMWLYLALSTSLLILPWLDQRPESPAPEI